MKPQPQSENDRQMDRVLREWKLTTPLPPRFHEAVWHRIERSEAQAPGWQVWLWRMSAAIARPALATSYLGILLLAGGLAGYLQARHANAHAEAQLSAQYVQAVDPYQMPHH
jgi:hypothetical protein